MEAQSQFAENKEGTRGKSGEVERDINIHRAWDYCLAVDHSASVQSLNRKKNGQLINTNRSFELSHHCALRP